MTKSRYNWEDGPPLLENHSRCKHEIIRDYLIQYIDVLATSLLRYPDKTLNLTIVDGFAGGGKYLYQNKEVDGSPLVILKAVKTAKAELNIKHQRPGRNPLNVKVDFFFVERERSAAECLKKILRSEGYSGENIKVLNSEFSTKSQEIIQFIKGKSGNRPGRAIFILDQCGFSQVLFSQIRNIMSPLKAEVILTFAVDALLAFFKNGKSTLKTIGLTDPEIAQITSQHNNPDKCRKDIQYILSRHLQKTGAQFYTPFCIYGDTSNWGYWLVHLSGHYRARDEIMKIHWDKGNDLVHYGDAGIDMFGYRSKQDEGFTKQLSISEEFRFDRIAQEKVENALRKELPELMYEIEEISYKDLLIKIFNHTPANRDTINKVLWESIESKEFLISRRGPTNIKDKDVIKRSPQKVITFSKPK